MLGDENITFLAKISWTIVSVTFFKSAGVWGKKAFPLFKARVPPALAILVKSSLPPASIPSP